MAASGFSPDLEACGGFFPRASAEAARRPSLSYEQTLIVWDEAKGREHFVREVAFRDSSQTFGFVVPTPTRPEVAKVAKSPFASLRADFPFSPPNEGVGLGSLGGLGHGGGGRGSGGVTVLEVSKVGSFTAFVLAADDEAGLAKWLRDNGLSATSEAEVWLRHYVARRFFFVAMRYDPPPVAAPAAAAPASARKVRAETVRISFDAPLPFYPYLEPAPPPQVAKPPADPRLLEVWLVTRKAMAPIAARTAATGTTWVRPLAEGVRYPQASRAKLEVALGDEAKLLAPGELFVQRFVDQKTSRQGFGDVVFVPREPAPGDAARRASLRTFVSSLDPSLPHAGSSR